MRPAKNCQAGRGVQRTRRNAPCSRSVAMETEYPMIPMDMVVKMIMPTIRKPVSETRAASLNDAWAVAFFPR